MKRKIIVIENDVDIESREDSILISWNKNFDQDNTGISITKYVEDNSDYYKQKYLEWTYAFSKSKIGRTTLEEYYQIERGISFFWFTSIGQRCNIVEKSEINNAIKLLALEEIIYQNKVNEIVLISNSKELIALIHDFCICQKIKFIKKVSKKYFFFNLRDNIFFHFLSSIAYLFYFIFIRSFNFKKNQTIDDNSSIVFFDMFLNVKTSSENYINKTHYWGALPELLENLSIPVLWSHFFYKHKSIPNTRIAMRTCDKLNNIASIHQHRLVDPGFSLNILYSAFSNYIKFFFKSLKLRKKKKLFFKNEITSFNFYFLFEREFFSSCYGVNAIKNFLYFELIELFISKLSHKKVGFFIQENQPWEAILIHKWRKFNHGLIIGVPHSTLRYWDLRYFYPPKVYNELPKINLPFPDFIAVNSPIAERNLLLSKFPSKQIRKVEALRYMDLMHKNSKSLQSFKVKTILICGDFLLETNKKMLSCLYEALELNKGVFHLIFKPHPATPVPSSYFKKLNVIIKDDPLNYLLDEVDIAFTSNISSSSVDAFVLGKPLIQYIDFKYFNMSPLRGIDGVSYISLASELSSILSKDLHANIKEEFDYFFTDSSLEKWKFLITSCYN